MSAHHFEEIADLLEHARKLAELVKPGEMVEVVIRPVGQGGSVDFIAPTTSRAPARAHSGGEA